MKVALLSLFAARGFAGAATAANCSEVLQGLIVGSGSIEQIDSEKAGVHKEGVEVGLKCLAA